MSEDQELNEYANEQLAKLAEELNNLQMQYDTRLVAAILAGRSAMLHAMMINAEVMTQEEARAVWKHAGQLIENPPDRESKVVKLYNGEILEPTQVN